MICQNLWILLQPNVYIIFRLSGHCKNQTQYNDKVIIQQYGSSNMKCFFSLQKYSFEFLRYFILELTQLLKLVLSKHFIRKRMWYCRVYINVLKVAFLHSIRESVIRRYPSIKPSFTSDLYINYLLNGKKRRFCQLRLCHFM